MIPREIDDLTVSSRQGGGGKIEREGERREKGIVREEKDYSSLME